MVCKVVQFWTALTCIAVGSRIPSRMHDQSASFTTKGALFFTQKSTRDMPMIVKKFSDGSYLEYAEGSFDKWCVYMVNPAKNFRQPPRDIHYFGFLANQSSVFGWQKIYDDFVSLYQVTNREVEESVLARIDKISAGYGSAALEFSKIYTILYMGMVAEEKKAGTRLGKRIKRLGVYKLLVEKKAIEESANFMRGMNWRAIDTLCRKRGF